LISKIYSIIKKRREDGILYDMKIKLSNQVQSHNRR